MGSAIAVVSHKRAQQPQMTVLLHGFFMRAWMMYPLAKRLQQQGFDTVCLSYASRRCTPAQNAQRLAQQILALNKPCVHLCGYSLGGLVIAHLLSQEEGLPPGRVVYVASPINGCRFVKICCKNTLLRWFFKHSVTDGLVDGAPVYTGDREFARIVGTSPAGLSSLFYKPSEINDGVVCETETKADYINVAMSVPHSHAIMPYSRRVAAYVGQFLSNDRRGALPDG